MHRAAGEPALGAGHQHRVVRRRGRDDAYALRGQATSPSAAHPENSYVRGDNVVFNGDDTVAVPYSATTVTVQNGSVSFPGDLGEVGTLTVASTGQGRLQPGRRRPRHVDVRLRDPFRRHPDRQRQLRRHRAVHLAGRHAPGPVGWHALTAPGRPDDRQLGPGVLGQRPALCPEPGGGGLQRPLGAALRQRGHLRERPRHRGFDVAGNWFVGYSFALGGDNGMFTNEGTVRKTAEAGTADFGLEFDNTGSVSVQSGLLNFVSLATSGLITVNPGASLAATSYTQTGGATTLDGGTLAGGSFNIDAGILSGSGVLCRKPLGRLRRSICMTTSKSPRRVLQVAYDAARRALPAHRHKFSPKKFTQPQLMGCLVLKEFLRTDYRGLAAHLTDHPDLTRLIDLKAVPHFTTFQKAARRLLVAAPARAMFDAVLDRRCETRSAGGGSRWRPSTAPGWSRGTSAATTSNGGPRPEVAPGRRLTRSTRRSSWSPTAGPTWCWRRCPAGAPARTWCSSRRR